MQSFSSANNKCGHQERLIAKNNTLDFSNNLCFALHKNITRCFSGYSYEEIFVYLTLIQFFHAYTV